MPRRSRALPANRFRKALFEQLEERKVFAAALDIDSHIEVLENKVADLALRADIQDPAGNGFNGGRLTVAITANGTSDDRLYLWFFHGITAEGNELSYYSQPLGHYYGGEGGQPLQILLEQNATAQAVSVLYANLNFTTVTDSPDTSDRTINISLADGTGAVLSSQNVTASVVAINDRPSLLETASSGNYLLRQAPVPLAPHAELVDPDSRDFSNAAITATLADSNDGTSRLSLLSTLGLQVHNDAVLQNGVAVGVLTTDAQQLVVTFNSAADLAAVQTTIRSIAFDSIANIAPTDPVQISLSFKDAEGAKSDLHIKTFRLSSFNHVPDISGIADVNHHEFDSTLIAPAAVVSDTDDPSIHGLSLSIEFIGKYRGGDYLYLKNQGMGPGQVGVTRTTVNYSGAKVGRIVGGFNGEPLKIVFTAADATGEALQAILRAVTFENASSKPSEATRILQMRMQNGVDTAEVSKTWNINFSALNTPPLIITASSTSGYRVGGDPLNIFPNDRVIDADSDNFDQGLLTVLVSGNSGSTDQLALPSIATATNPIAVVNGDVLFGELAIGTVVQGAPSTLQVRFNAQATPERVGSLLRSITFSTTGTDATPLVRTVSYTLSDGDGATSDMRSADIYVALPIADNPAYGLQSLVYAQGGGYVPLAPQVVLPDVTAYAGGFLNAVIARDDRNKDSLQVLVQGNEPGQIFVDGSNIVRYGGQPIGQVITDGNQVSLKIQLSPGISNEAIQALTRCIDYLGYDGSPYRDATIWFSRSGLESFTLPSIPIVVQRYNFDPIVTLNEPQYAEGDLPVFAFPNSTVTDDSQNFGGGLFRFTATSALANPSDARPYDSLRVSDQGDDVGQIGVSGGTIRFGGIVIAHYSGGFAGNTLQIVLNENSSRESVQAMMRRITYQCLGPLKYGSHSIAAQYSDGDSAIREPIKLSILVFKDLEDLPEIINLPAISLDVNDVEPIAPSAEILDPDSSSYSGNWFFARTLDPNDPPVHFNILNQGDGPGQFRLTGGNLYYENRLVGRVFYDWMAPLFVAFEAPLSKEGLQNFVRSLGFTSTIPAHSARDFTVEFELFQQSKATLAVNLRRPNAPPMLDVSGVTNYSYTINTIENAKPLPIVSQAFLFDHDNDNFEGGRLEVAFAEGTSVDSRLTIDDQVGDADRIRVIDNQVTYAGIVIGEVTGGSNALPLIVAFNTNATLPLVRQLIQAVAFTNVSDNPPPTQHVSFFVTDGDGGVSDTTLCTINITAVDDPTFLAVGGQVDLVENRDIPVAPSALVVDVDGGGLEQSVLTVDVQAGQSGDNLNIGSSPIFQAAAALPSSGAAHAALPLYVDGVLIGVYSKTSSTALSATFNSSATLSLIQSFLRQIHLQSLSQIGGARNVKFKLTSAGGLASNVATVKVNVTAVNDAPMISAVPAVTHLKSTAWAVPIAPNAMVYDPDSANFDRGRLSVFNPSANAGDELLLWDPTSKVTTRGNLVLVNGTSIGSFAGGHAGTPLLVNFNSSATPGAAQAVLNAVALRSSVDRLVVGIRQLTITLSDGDGGTSKTINTSIIIDANHAPVVTGGVSTSLPNINEDVQNPLGITVAALLSGGVSDEDYNAARGIAVVSAPTSGGSWQFSLNNRVTWTAIGNVSDTNARLLPVTAIVRFVPKPNFNGSLTIQYRAWDQTQGSVGAVANLSRPESSGGATAFSAKSLSSVVHVISINDAPKLDASFTPALATIDEDNRNAYGTPVWTLLGGMTDVDASSLRGTAITAASGTANGMWQYTLDSGGTWQALGGVSLSAAKLVPALGNASRIRFLPNQDFTGTVQIGFVAWDQTHGLAGGSWDISQANARGGTTAFSNTFDSAALTIRPVNDAPLITFPIATVGYALNKPAILVSGAATVRDVDSLAFAGGWLNVQITKGVDSQDRLSIGGTFKISNGNLIWNNTVSIGIITPLGGVGTSPLRISFNSDATQYRVEQLLRSIKFSTASNGKVGQRTIAFQASDGTTVGDLRPVVVQVN